MTLGRRGKNHEDATVCVLLDHGRSSASGARQQRDLSNPRDNPYGYLYATSSFDIQLARDRSESPVTRTVRRGLKMVLGFDIIHVTANLELLRRADAVWVHTEKEGVALAILQKFGLCPAVPTVFQSIWLWDRWSHFSWMKKRLLLALINEDHIVHTTHSPINAAVAAAALGRQAIVVPFGIEPLTTRRSAQQPADRDIARVAVFGNDRHRAWPAVHALARLRPAWQIAIHSRRRAARPPVPLDNVKIERLPSQEAVEDAYGLADVVLVPVVANGHVSGMTVIQEALQRGLPVAASDAGGLRHFYDGVVSFAEDLSPKSLASAIEEAFGAKRSAGQSWLDENGLTARDYAERHVLLTVDMLELGKVRLATASRVGGTSSLTARAAPENEADDFDEDPSVS